MFYTLLIAMYAVKNNLCVWISGKYHDLERQLIQEFTAAQRRGEIGRMREVAAVLLHFKVR